MNDRPRMLTASKLMSAAGGLCGIDVQILGIGSNGHIGFNEPTSLLSSRTRKAALAYSTRGDNARFFENEGLVPTHCVTQGLGTIMEARKLLLVAEGPTKAKAIESAIEGPISSMCPASILQMHADVVVIIDGAASRRLQFDDYYEHADAGLVVSSGPAKTGWNSCR